MTPNERAAQAKILLESEIFDEAFKALDARLTSLWKSSHPDQWKYRERVFDQLGALQDVKHLLEDFINTAAMETTANR
jgi:hypothetical protein